MTINEFRNKIIRLTPNNFMNMNGAEAGILGTNSGMHIVQELQQATIDFAHSYKMGNDDLTEASKLVIAKILVAQTLDIMSEKSADELLEDIAELMKERK